MLAQDEIDLLRKTPLVMLDCSELAAQTFYETLFEMAPEVRSLFPSQMSDQSRKFAATLIVAINSLSDWNALRPVIEALSRRHLNYGVAAHHYETVGKALMKTLTQFDASPAELTVWREVYQKLSNHMVATAYPAEQIP